MPVLFLLLCAWLFSVAITASRLISDAKKRPSPRRYGPTEGIAAGVLRQPIM